MLVSLPLSAFAPGSGWGEAAWLWAVSPVFLFSPCQAMAKGWTCTLTSPEAGIDSKSAPGRVRYLCQAVES